MTNAVPRFVLAGIGMVSMGTLLFEVTLTRIFAVTIWYYFGSLAISLALLGLSASAICCFVFSDRFLGKRADAYLVLFPLLFAVSAPLSVFVHLQLELDHYSANPVGFFLTLGLQILFLVVPFFCSGMCISIALYRYSSQIHRVYFIDLVGASFGSILVVWMLYRFSGPAIIFGVAAVAAAAGLLFSFSKGALRNRSLIALVVLVAGALLFLNDDLGVLKISRVKSYTPGSLQRTEKDRVYEEWCPLSRVAVFAPVREKNATTMTVTYDAGAPTFLHSFSGDPAEVAYLRDSPKQVVHHLKPNADVLVIGSGGGADVLSALAFGQRKITAVEINPVVAKLVTRTYADYIGRIFEDPRVSLEVRDGRNYVAGTTDKFDIIQITMIDSWVGAAAGAYLFNENSLYTKEAIRDYVRRLKPGGVLSITRYYEWDEALRLTNLVASYLVDAGSADDVWKRVAVVWATRIPTYRQATVLLKNGDFTQEESMKLLTAAKRNGSPVIYAPHLRIEDMDPAEYSGLFRALIAPSVYADGRSREQVVAEYPKDISASTDDKPFFFFNTRLRHIFTPNPYDHASRRMAMPLLYGCFAVFAILGFLAILLPLRLSGKGEVSTTGPSVRLLAYFGCLGAGYMLIEIPLIQRLTIFLGHPTYSFVLVLAVLLFSSGLGSLASGDRDPQTCITRLLRVLAGVSIAIVLYVTLAHGMLIDLMSLSKPARITLAVVLLFPPGFLMGMCFPLGIRIARAVHPRLVPWGWGVNGAFSVFASSCALILALNFGLRVTILSGLLCYAVAFVIILTVRSTPAFFEGVTENKEEPNRPQEAVTGSGG